MKTSLFRIKEKSKKIMSSSEFGFDVFLNESNVSAIFLITKTGCEINSDKTVSILAKITTSKAECVSKIDYIDNKNLNIANKNKIMDMVGAYIKDNFAKKKDL